VIHILKFIARHPLTRGRRSAAIARFVRYQLATRLRGETVMPWFGGASLVVSRNMAGASGNIYCGLHEFADMGFLLHFLRPDDLFLDIGANVGSYTVLASKVCGARTIAFEPDPITCARLLRNVAENGIEERVDLVRVALSDREGEIGFSLGDDTTNRVVDDKEAPRRVAGTRLDTALGGRRPIAIKMDVEGVELSVLRGAAKTLASPDLQVIETEGVDPEIVALLTAHGFARVHYDPFARDFVAAASALPASNALFVRDIELCRQRVEAAPRRQINGVSL
jgi:FkbM family methyltransferase